jgi:outer membrane lipoprotein-sorting protein
VYFILNAKRAVLVMLTCIILGISQVLPVIGSVQSGKETTSVKNSVPSLQAEADTYEITLKIIGPDGTPTIGAS